MKTIKQWFETLPEPERSQAMKNAYDLESTAQVFSLTIAIKSAFHWNETPEGDEYWNQLAEKYKA